MSYDSNSVLNGVMATLLRTISPRQASSFYKVPYRSIVNITRAQESIQEQRVTPQVENENQQQKYRWVRKHLLIDDTSEEEGKTGRGGRQHQEQP